VFLSPVKQEGPQAPPRVKRKAARPSLFQNLDSDQQRMKRMEISIETDKLDRLHKVCHRCYNFKELGTN
jgi:hypothetical protein